MPKTKEQIKAYNKEYFARPEVIERAKIRNAKYRQRRAEYKKTEQGKAAEAKYRAGEAGRRTLESKRLKNLYGITLKDYERMYESQKGRCMICYSHKEKLHVDHCHETNRVRGLLCGTCNRGLGMFKDNFYYLDRAAEYLTNVR